MIQNGGFQRNDQLKEYKEVSHTTPQRADTKVDPYSLYISIQSMSDLSVYLQLCCIHANIDMFLTFTAVLEVVEGFDLIQCPVQTP